MILDLASLAEDVKLDAAVVIVGGGIAGLLLGHRLRAAKIKVAVVESGGAGADGDADAERLNDVVQLGDKYLGATLGRARGLGGTSSRWGGALIPFLPEDLDARPHLDLPAWPVSSGEIESHRDDIERLFRVEAASYEEDLTRAIHAERIVPTGDPDFRARYAKWPTFKLRNVATLLKEEIARDAGFVVLLNATVVAFEANGEQGAVRSIVAKAPNDRTAHVTGRQFVICAGAIESTRLLLLLDRQHDGAVFRDKLAPGPYLFDHLSMAAASIETARPQALNRLGGFRFRGQTMRSLRFELTPRAQARERVGSLFGHIVVNAQAYGGYDALRDLLRAVQARKQMSPQLLAKVLRDWRYLLRLGYWRYAKGQLLWPAPAHYLVEVVSEQLPRADNRIALATDTDRYGVPRAAIDWRPNASDLAPAMTFRRVFDEFWQRNGLERVGKLHWTLADDLERRHAQLRGDIFHPGGSTRMGVNARAGVVDRDLRVFAASNLSIASASTFPTGASANPTLTIMCLALRLGDRLARELSTDG